MTELRTLAPETETIKLTTGTEVVIEDLKTRQFFKLLRILTRGGLGALNDARMMPSPDESVTDFFTKLLTLLVLSIPEAENETVDFVRSMCSPVGLIPGGRKQSKADAERNAELWARLDTELDNPELEDLLTIVEAVVRREAEDIQALGKRLAGMLKLAERTGQLPADQIQVPTPTSLEDSPDPSTSSAASTDGTTTSSAS